MAIEAMQMDAQGYKRKRSGVHCSRSAVFLTALVISVALSATIALAVLFSEQNAEITNLKSKQTPKPSPPTPAGTNSTPTPTTTTLESTTSVPKNATYRLPKSIYPSHYRLNIKVNLPHPDFETDPTLDFTTEGEAKIDFEVREETSQIVLHAWDMTIDSVVLHRNSSPIPISSMTEDKVRNFLKLDVAEPLAVGGGYRLTTFYRAKIVTDNQGLYRSSYVLNNKTYWLAATQFQAYKARRAFPCFDEPEFRATFRVTLKHRKEFNATFTIRKPVFTRTAEDNENWTETEFSLSQRMPTYLMAFVVSDFARDSVMVNENLEFGVISRRDAIDDTLFARETGVNNTKYLGALLGVGYEEYNDRLDMAAIPDFDAGAMENWGLVLYRETLMLYRNGISSAEDKKQIGRVIAHEIAHQWFGNKITCSWWEETFLNEGFATFFEYPVTHHWKPEWKMWDIFTLTTTRSAYEADSYTSSIPLYRPGTETTSQIDQMFGTVTYQKGGAVLRMILEFMGADNFYAALRAYIDKQRKTGITTHRDLLQALTDQMAKTDKKEDMKQRFEGWITQPGFPLITATRNESNLVLQQERFKLDTTAPFNAAMWHVPITMTVSSAVDPANNYTEFWLQSRFDLLPNVVPESARWYLLNVGHRGYYRVNYDDENWEMLSAQLMENHNVIPLSSRTQLIDDAFTLARKGIVKYGMPLKLNRYLTKELEYSPWKAALESLAYIARMIDATKVQPYMSGLLKNKYSDSLWDTTTVWVDDQLEDYTGISLHSNLIENACFHAVGSCLSTAGRYFREWKENKTTLNPHLMEHTLCYGVRNGDAEDFEYLLAEYPKFELNSVKLLVLRGLACTSDEKLINRLLELTLDNSVIRSQDTFSVFRYLARFPAGEKLGWEFAKKNWSKLSKRDNIVNDMTIAFNTQEELKDVEDFYQSLGTGISEKPTFETVLNRIRANIAWMESYSGAVEQALAQKIF